METPEMLGKLIDTSLEAVQRTYNSGKTENSPYCMVDAYDGRIRTKCRFASLGC